MIRLGLKMRLKYTYFICELDFGSGGTRCCSQSELYASIKRLYTELYGDAGWGKAATSLAVKHVDPSTRLSIVRASTESRPQLHACLALLKSVGGLPVAVCVRGCASTIRTLKEQYRRLCGNFRAREDADGPTSLANSATQLFWESLDAES